MLAYILSQLSVFDELQKPSAHKLNRAEKLIEWMHDIFNQEKNLSNFQQSRT